MPGYFLKYDPLIGKQVCKSCMNIINYCTSCDSVQCFSCESPYLLGQDGTCSLCMEGYELNDGICSSIAGCQREVILSNGTKICVACIRSLNFVYDNRLLKCVCMEGFKEFHQIGFLPKCLPICGDGIIIT